MKNTITSLFLSFFCFTLTAAPMPMGFDSNYPEHIVVNNRILLKVNGKSVSVMDVVRKMDLLFFRQYPELASSVPARYQFYQLSWRPILAAVIDDQLIMADAAEKEIKVSDGEVREEMDKLFGSNAVLKIDELGMTYQEAWELLKTELTVQRMTSIMVRPKAMTDVTPKLVKELYEKAVDEKPPQNQWIYRLISIRSKDEETLHKAAEEAYRLLVEQNVPFDMLSSSFQDEETQIAVSEEYVREENALSSAHKAALASLSAGAYSLPMSQGTVSRIFFLKEYEEGKTVAFSEMEEKLKQQLIQEAFIKHNTAYREKLRKHYGFSEKYLAQILPEELEPFALR